MKRGLLGLMFAVLALAAGAGPGHAQCFSAVINGNNFTASGTYDPFSASDTSDSYSFTMRNTSAATCSFGIVFNRFSLPATLGGLISYQITNSSGSGSLITSTGLFAPPSNYLRVVSVAPGATVVVTYRVFIARGQVVAPGSYQDTLQLRLYYESSPGTLFFFPLDTAGLTVRYTVPTSISTNVAGGGQTTTIDFGELTAGESQSVDIEARSNVNYQMSVTSLNFGVLKQPIPLDAWTVGYGATLSGTALDLSTAAGTTIGPYTLTTVSGRTHPLAVTVGSVTDKRAGTYSDEITVRIEVAP